MKISKCIKDGSKLYFIHEYNLVTGENFHDKNVGDYFPTKLSFFGYLDQEFENKTKNLNVGKYNILNIYTKKEMYFEDLTNEEMKRLEKNYEQYCKTFVEPEPVEYVSVEEKKNFWKLVEELNYRRNGYDKSREIFISKYKDNLSERTRIIEIFRLMYHKLHEKLDLEYFFNPFFKKAYGINPGTCSDDEFDDFVSQIVSEGPECYYRALEDPVSATQTLFEESFAYVFHEF